MRGRLVLGLVAVAALSLPAVSGAKVLRVGTYHGRKGQYKTIQAAVKAAKPGDLDPGRARATTPRLPVRAAYADDRPSGAGQAPRPGC